MKSILQHCKLHKNFFKIALNMKVLLFWIIVIGNLLIWKEVMLLTKSVRFRHSVEPRWKPKQYGSDYLVTVYGLLDFLYHDKKVEQYIFGSFTEGYGYPYNQYYGCVRSIRFNASVYPIYNDLDLRHIGTEGIASFAVIFGDREGGFFKKRKRKIFWSYRNL